MRLLYLITKSEVGGAQTHVVDICSYFKKKGYEIAVMSSGDGYLKKGCCDLGVVFEDNIFFNNSANPIKIYKAIMGIRKYVREYKPDIVHCHSSFASILGRLVIRGKIRTIYTAHGWGFNIGMKLWVKYPVLFLEKLCAPYTDTYICVAKFVKNLGLKYRLAPESQFKVVYNGVKNQSQIMRNQSQQGERINLIFVGRLAEPKKPELIIDALIDLPEEVKKHIKFTIIGEGPKRKFLKTFLSDKRINIEFKGSLSRDRVLKNLKTADIFISISTWEGFPYTILEALSCGLPVVTNNVGGVAEVINSKNGILVNNEVGQIQEALLRLINDEKLRVELGEQARLDILEKFSIEKMLQKIEEIYLLAHKR